MLTLIEFLIFLVTNFLLCRYKIKLEVFDGTDSGNFLLFDSDAHHLIKKSCKDMLGNLKVSILFLSD